MKITIKCPNCYQQVTPDNRFCVYCGYDLSEASAPEETPAAAPVFAADAPETASAPYDGPRYCPMGHDVPDPSLGFCPTCGSPLVDSPAAAEETPVYETAMPVEEPAAYAAEPEPVREAPAAPVTRKCKCGYVCDDPELNFCPSCGMPFDAPSSEWSEDPGWWCVCGENNTSDMAFCVACGKPKGYKTIEEPAAKKETEAIPAGMKPPTDFDLNKKASYEGDTW